MPNVNSGGTPLQPPSQLWGPQKQAPVGTTRPQPARQSAPQTAPSTQSLPQTLPPLPKLPPKGQSMPVLSFASQPTPQQGLGTKLGQLKDMIKGADDRLLTLYNIKTVKDPSGKISGYELNGKPATAQEIQSYLLPRSGVLHQQINDLKQEVQQTHANFKQYAQQMVSAMAPAEQTATQIQLQAVDVVYQSFVNRLDQVDSLIR